MKPTTTTRPLQKRSKKHRNSWKPASNTSATLKASNCSESVNEPAQKRWGWCCNGVAEICAPPKWRRHPHNSSFFHCSLAYCEHSRGAFHTERALHHRPAVNWFSTNSLIHFLIRRGFESDDPTEKLDRIRAWSPSLADFHSVYESLSKLQGRSFGKNLAWPKSPWLFRRGTSHI